MTPDWDIGDSDLVVPNEAENGSEQECPMSQMSDLTISLSADVFSCLSQKSLILHLILLSYRFVESDVLLGMNKCQINKLAFSYWKMFHLSSNRQIYFPGLEEYRLLKRLEFNIQFPSLSEISPTEWVMLISSILPLRIHNALIILLEITPIHNLHSDNQHYNDCLFLCLLILQCMKSSQSPGPASLTLLLFFDFCDVTLQISCGVARSLTFQNVYLLSEFSVMT